MSKPRTFWINTLTAEIHYDELKGVDGNVHVIEKSAYDDLKKQLAESQSDLLDAHDLRIKQTLAESIVTCDMPSEFITASNGERYVQEVKLTEARKEIEALNAENKKMFTASMRDAQDRDSLASRLAEAEGEINVHKGEIKRLLGQSNEANLEVERLKADNKFQFERVGHVDSLLSLAETRIKKLRDALANISRYSDNRYNEITEEATLALEALEADDQLSRGGES